MCQSLECEIHQEHNPQIAKSVNLQTEEPANCTIHRLKNMSICRVQNVPITQSVYCGICQSIHCRLSIMDRQIIQSVDCAIGRFPLYRLTNSAIYGLCAWQIPHSRDGQFTQFMDSQMHQSMNCIIIPQQQQRMIFKLAHIGCPQNTQALCHIRLLLLE